MQNKQPKAIPLLGVVGYSGTGKTTLLKKLIPLLKQQGLNIALIKHAHHDVEIDTPGKDSYELRKAGAEQTLVVCDNRWALMTETPDEKPNIKELISKFDHNKTDLILLEGFKHEPFNKIALYRANINRPFADLIDPYTIALACDQNLTVNIPLLDINNPQQISEFIYKWLHKVQN